MSLNFSRKTLSKILIFIFLLTIVFALGYVLLLFIQYNPQKVRVTNITDRSATITWHTDSPTTGIVNWRSSDGNKGIAYDDRDYQMAELIQSTEDPSYQDVIVKQRSKYYTHHVTLRGLKPNSEYTFAVSDGFIVKSKFDFAAADKEMFSAVNEAKFITTQELQNTQAPNPTYGKIVMEDDSYIGGDGIVFLSAVRDGKLITLSAVLNDQGRWYIDLTTARKDDGQIMSFDDDTDIQNVKAETAYGDSAVYTVSMNMNAPMENIKLTKDRNLKASLLTKVYACTGGSYSNCVKQCKSDCGKGADARACQLDCEEGCSSECTTTPAPTIRSRVTETLVIQQEENLNVHAEQDPRKGCPGCGGICDDGYQTLTEYPPEGDILATCNRKCDNGQWVAGNSCSDNANGVSRVNCSSPKCVVNDKCQLNGWSDGTYQCVNGALEDIAERELRALAGLGGEDGELEASSSEIICYKSSPTGICERFAHQGFNCPVGSNKDQSAVCPISILLKPINEQVITDQSIQEIYEDVIEGLNEGIEETEEEINVPLVLLDCSSSDADCGSYGCNLICEKANQENGCQCGGALCFSHKDAIYCDVRLANRDMQMQQELLAHEATHRIQAQYIDMWGDDWTSENRQKLTELGAEYNSNNGGKYCFTTEDGGMKGTDVVAKLLEEGCDIDLLEDVMNGDRTAIEKVKENCGIDVNEYIKSHQLSGFDQNCKNKITFLNNLFKPKAVQAQESEPKIMQIEYSGEYIIKAKESGVYRIEIPGALPQEITMEAGREHVLFFDRNGNGQHDEGETIEVQDDTVKISYIDQKVSSKISLSEGINIVSFNELPNNTDSCQLIKDLNIGYQKNVNPDAFVSQIARYVGTTFEVTSYRPDIDQGTSGKCFPVRPGEGYILRSHSDIDISYVGYRLAIPAPIKISQVGWNLIGVNGSNKSWTAEKLIDEFNSDERFEVDNLSRWRNESSMYQGLQKNKLENQSQFETFGFDYPLSNDEGYFIRVLKGTGVLEIE